MRRMIKNEEVDVVVQGIVDGERTKLCIESIRTFLPGARVILSTWKGQKLNLNVDLIVESDDPGNLSVNLLGNINREIVGRMEGLRVCERKYTLIIRSDSKILNLNFVDEFERDYERGRYKAYDFLEKRVIMCSSGNMKNSLYFLCDWFFFGLTIDLIKLYDLPLFDKKEIEDTSLPQYSTPHEYLAINFVKKFIELKYDYSRRKNKKEKEQWEKILCENFITLGFYENYGILNLKEPYYSNQIRNASNFFCGMKHLMLNYEKEDWILIYNRLYRKRERIEKRLEWRAGWIGIRVYRMIKPVKCSN